MSQSTTIFKRLLGETYQQLPPILQEFHNTSEVIWQGIANAKGSTHFMAKLIRKLMGFPEPADELPVKVKVTITDKGEERWTRNFANKEFSSYLAIDSRAPKQMYERFGLVKQYFTLKLVDNWLCWHLSHCTLLSIKLPSFLQPKVIANEGVTKQGSYQFIAKVTLPIIGILVEYKGYLNKVIDPL